MLHRLLPWLGRTYPDAHLAFRARITLAEDPRLADVTLVSITSAHGVLRLKGRVPQGRDKGRIEGQIRGTLHMAGLLYVRLINTLYAIQPAQQVIIEADVGLEQGRRLDSLIDTPVHATQVFGASGSRILRIWLSLGI